MSSKKRKKAKKEEKKRLAKELRRTEKKLSEAHDSEVSREALERRAAKLERKLEKARRTNEKVHGRREEPEPTRLFDFTQNREVSWLRFNDRVLDEAFDETVPLFERLKFVSIFGSNLDEWFMVRIGGLSDLAMLKQQPRDTRSNQTPSEQITCALEMLPPMIERQGQVFSGIEANLAGAGLSRVGADDLTDADLNHLAQHYASRISPIISPMIIDPRHPFPNLKNGRLYVACSLDGPEETGVLGLVEVPHSLDRVVPLPSTPRNYRYTLLEDIILFRLGDCFGDYVPTSSAVIRVTRNADIDPDGEGVEEEEDYRQHMKSILRERLRLQPVRLEVDGELDPKLERFVADSMHLTANRVFHTSMPLDLGYVYGLEEHIPDASRPKLLFDPFEPQPSPMVDPRLDMRQQVEDHDILLCYPYESMNPLLGLLREASGDDSCISIKVTLYRIAKQSKLCESLIAAVENGKEVTVLMELRARFDEENNIAWAERLEDAGCTVIYGSEGFKCHSKICLITYHDAGHIRRITCLGTGNFNEKTARLYSDFMLLTAHEGIGEDGNTFFRNLSLGNLRGSYRHLGVAPIGLKPLVMAGLDREIERARAGEDALVFMKMNSLTDRDVIDKIAEACEAGVRVIMIIRGITCIRANIPGRTEGLMVRQIVGRFLEHARVYAFGTEADLIYLSSADMMTRNTEHRVEIAYPVLDETCRKLVVQFINIQLADNDKARELTADGTWDVVEPEPGEPTIDAQELLLALAYRRGRGERLEDEAAAISHGIHADLPLELMRRLAALPSASSYGDEAARDMELPARTEAGTGPRAQDGGHDAGGVADSGQEAPVAAQEPAEAARKLPRDPQAEGPDGATRTGAAVPQGEAAHGPGGHGPVSHVQATIIDDEADGRGVADGGASATDVVSEAVRTAVTEGGSSDTPTDGTGAATPSTSIEQRTPSRFAVALRLIGMGLKELFTGRISRQARKEAARGSRK